MGSIRKRTIYVGTIVAVLALVSGFAVAILGGGLTAGTSSGLNNGTFTVPQNTPYGGTVNLYVNLGGNIGAGNSCTTATAISPFTVSGTGTDAIYESALAGGACHAGDVYVGVEFPAASLTGANSDTFAITFPTYSGGPANSATGTASAVVVAGGYTGSEDLTIWVDDGALGTANAATVSVTVTGT